MKTKKTESTLHTSETERQIGLILDLAQARIEEREDDFRGGMNDNDDQERLDNLNSDMAAVEPLLTAAPSLLSALEAVVKFIGEPQTTSENSIKVMAMKAIAAAKED